MKKKLLVFFITLILFIGVTGCGTKQSNSDSDVIENSEEGETGIEQYDENTIKCTGPGLVFASCEMKWNEDRTDYYCAPFGKSEFTVKINDNKQIVSFEANEEFDISKDLNGIDEDDANRKAENMCEFIDGAKCNGKVEDGKIKMYILIDSKSLLEDIGLSDYNSLVSKLKEQANHNGGITYTCNKEEIK